MRLNIFAFNSTLLTYQPLKKTHYAIWKNYTKLPRFYIKTNEFTIFFTSRPQKNAKKFVRSEIFANFAANTS